MKSSIYVIIHGTIPAAIALDTVDVAAAVARRARSAYNEAVGKRGAQPSSGRVFQGLPVVIGARRHPFVHMPTLDVGGDRRPHPLVTGRGYVPVLRLVASQMKLGRDSDGRSTPFLTRGQAVQPLDGNPWNWDRRNIAVFRLGDQLPKAVKSPPARPRKKSR